MQYKKNTTITKAATNQVLWYINLPGNWNFNSVIPIPYTLSSSSFLSVLCFHNRYFRMVSSLLLLSSSSWSMKWKWNVYTLDLWISVGPILINFFTWHYYMVITFYHNHFQFENSTTKSQLRSIRQQSPTYKIPKVML